MSQIEQKEMQQPRQQPRQQPDEQLPSQPRMQLPTHPGLPDESELDLRISPRKIWGHFKTITHHKLLVMRYCFKAGLYKQGLLHDMSKYAPVEFISGVRYYQGFRSPNAAERMHKGFSEAWLHHKGCNPHHWEYWCDIKGAGDHRFVGYPMPTRYVVEMFCDRIAACRVYEKEAYTNRSALAYFERESAGDPAFPMHPATAALLRHLLEMLAEKGEEETFGYVRREIVQARYVEGSDCGKGSGGRF